MSIKHRKVSAIADGPNPLQVQPTSDWNDDHLNSIPGSLIAGITDTSDYPIMPGIMGASQYLLWRANAPNSFGFTPLSIGTPATPVFVAASIRERTQRLQYASAAVANAATGVRANVACFICRSTTAGRGGFLYHARLALETNMGGATGRLFAGLHATQADLITDPSTLTGDFIGIAYDAADTHLRLMSRDNVTTQNVDLGATVPKTDNLMYDIYLYCPPGGAAIYYRIDQANGNVFTQRLAEGNLAVNLPRTDIALSPRAQGSTSGATAVTLAIAQMGCIWQSN